MHVSKGLCQGSTTCLCCSGNNVLAAISSAGVGCLFVLTWHTLSTLS